MVIFIFAEGIFAVIPRLKFCEVSSFNAGIPNNLAALEELNLLKAHRVIPKQRRIVWFGTHWTAAIAEIDSGAEFAVDSWYHDNGELPMIAPLADWYKKRKFTAAYNPELESL